jgi:hypothetical protein
MQNLKKSEKSKGIVAFASNTDTTDYVAIAGRTLRLASKTLGLPATLITPDAELPDNKRYDIDTKEFVQWRNAGRYQAYQLSPYDETIVIDADYLVFDQNILKIFECEWDYTIMRQARGLTQEFPQDMGPRSLPYVWATVFAFRRTPTAEMFFSLVQRVQDNYNYYRELFNIEQRNFRNDYAFAIADIILNGYAIGEHGIPGPMLHVDQPVVSIEAKGSMFVIKDNTQAFVVPRMNLHVMSKQYLQSEQFKEFIDSESA